MTEARILTGEPFESIGTRLNVSPKAIEYFEQIFFDVRGRLQFRDFILNEVIGTMPSAFDRRGELSTSQMAYLYRSFAYFGGALALDALISSATPTKPKSDKDLRLWLKDVTGRITAAQAAAAATTLRPTKTNLTQIIKIAADINKDVETVADSQLNRLMDSLGAMFSSIEFSMAARDVSELSPAEQFFLNSPIEPRADEMIALANGKMPDSLLEAAQRFHSATSDASAQSSAPDDAS